VLACLRSGEFSALALGGGGHRKLLWRQQPDTARGAGERVLLLTIHNYCCQPRTLEGCGFFMRARFIYDMQSAYFLAHLDFLITLLPPNAYGVRIF